MEGDKYVGEAERKKREGEVKRAEGGGGGGRGERWRRESRGVRAIGRGG